MNRPRAYYRHHRERAIRKRVRLFSQTWRSFALVADQPRYPGRFAWWNGNCGCRMCQAFDPGNYDRPRWRREVAREVADSV